MNKNCDFGQFCTLTLCFYITHVLAILAINLELGMACVLAEILCSLVSILNYLYNPCFGRILKWLVFWQKLFQSTFVSTLGAANNLLMKVFSFLFVISQPLFPQCQFSSFSFFPLVCHSIWMRRKLCPRNPSPPNWTSFLSRSQGLHFWRPGLKLTNNIVASSSV